MNVISFARCHSLPSPDVSLFLFNLVFGPQLSLFLVFPVFSPLFSHPSMSSYSSVISGPVCFILQFSVIPPLLYPYLLLHVHVSFLLRLQQSETAAREDAGWTRAFN